MWIFAGADPQRAIHWAAGTFGIGFVFVYSFLVAFALPLPGELVLFVPLGLGLSRPHHFAVVILVSAVGKALGSVFALELQRTAADADDYIPDRIDRYIPDGSSSVSKRLGVDIGDWVEDRTVRLVRRYGYVGLTALLAVPGAPDTVSIYAFSVLEENRRYFAVAAFVGTVIRLVVTLAIVRGAVSLSGLA